MRSTRAMRGNPPSGRRSILVYGSVLVLVAVGADAAGVPNPSSRWTGVAVWLAIMLLTIVSRADPLQVGRGATQLERARPRRSEVFGLLAITVVGVPIVYLLGRTVGQSVLEVALVVVVVAIAGGVARRRGRDRRPRRTRSI